MIHIQFIVNKSQENDAAKRLFLGGFVYAGLRDIFDKKNAVIAKLNKWVVMHG